MKRITARLLVVGSLSFVTLFLLVQFPSRLPSRQFISIVRTGGSVGPAGWLTPFQGPHLEPSAWLLAIATYVLVATIDLLHARQAILAGARHSYFSTPRTRAERLWWIGISIVAGLTEELTWRAVQPALIAQLMSSLGLAMLLSAMAFGIGHIDQGIEWALATIAVALLFHLLVWFSGTIWLAVAVHILVNVTTGLWSGSFAMRVESAAVSR